ncbi:hypothetical protein DFH29DRAFT_543834 [Suillus ampliporus]|nr:hypothetical protein DFH29DRAFT_543834 [Suillus ampliporus]
MTVQDPPWRQKTRPCPFFSQGRCLFSDSCNFLHDIKVKSALDQSLVDAQPVRPRVFLPPKTVLNPPSVVVNSASPRSTQLVSPVDDTSRYSGLLSVLQDVIGPTTHQDDETLALQPVDMNDIFLQDSQADTTVVNISIDTSFTEVSTLVEDSCDSQDSSVTEAPRDMREIQENLTRHDIDSDDYEETGDIFPSYLVEDEDAAEEQELDREEEGEDKSQSTSITVLQFPTPPSRFSATSTTSSVLSLLALPYGLTEEPLDDPGQEACNNLLSPVELSARLRPFSMYDHNCPPKREDSIDSGYADSWTGPALLARSPPHLMRNSIAFDSTPFRRSSISSSQDRRVSYDVRGIRPSPRQPVVAEEYEDDAFSTLSIIDAYDFSFDLDEEPLSPTMRLTGMVAAPPLSPPAESSFSKEPSVPISVAPIHDNALEASPLQCGSASEDGAGHTFLDADSPLAESLVSTLSSSTIRPSSVKGTPPVQEVVPVGMKICSLPPSPLPKPPSSDAVHIRNRADDVVTPSSVSSSANDSEFMEGELSSKISLLSLGTFPSGRSSPNTSILSAECDHAVDDMSQETVFSQPSSRPQSDPAQSPTSSSVWGDDEIDEYGLQEDQLYTGHAKEGRESFIARPGEQSRISRELLAHIGHVFSLSDDMSTPAGDALDPTGSGVDVETDDHRDSWHDALNADVQQALRISAASPVMFLSGDTDFDHEEAGARASWDAHLGDFSVNLGRWSGGENVLPAEGGASASFVGPDESDALGDQLRTEGLLDDVVSLPATLAPPTGAVVRDVDAFLLQGTRDIQTADFHDQSPVDTIEDSLAASCGSADAPSTVEFVQRSRAVSDVTVKPDSRSPSAPCFPPSPVASILANLADTNFDNHPDFLQPLDDQNVDADPTESQSIGTTVVTVALETGRSPNSHPASVFESTAHDDEDKYSPVLVSTEVPSTHRVTPNLTIRIPPSFETQPSSSSTAQSLPLILSLSNRRDTRRWFSSSHGDGLSSAAVSPSSAPVISTLPSREAGSTKVPFGFRRFNPQLESRYRASNPRLPSHQSFIHHQAERVTLPRSNSMSTH